MAEMKQSQFMANNLGRRSTAQELAEEHNVNIDEALGIKKEGDKLGDKARYICKSLIVIGQCLLKEVKDTKKLSEWLNYYEPYTEKFKNMDRIIQNKQKIPNYDLQLQKDITI